jgi:hypothetical protein
VSEYVALRLPLPGAVVTWFVTGSERSGSKPVFQENSHGQWEEAPGHRC